MLVGYDDDLAGEVTRIANRIRGLLTQIHPPLERILGPRVQHPAERQAFADPVAAREGVDDGGIDVGVWPCDGFPPGVVDRGEVARGAGLLERGGAGQSAGFAQHRLQVVVEVQAGAALGHQPFVPGHLGAAVVDDQVGGA